MNLMHYPFHDLTEDNFHTIASELLTEAKKRGFYLNHTPYNSLFTSYFFQDKHPEYKPNVGLMFRNKVAKYIVEVSKSNYLSYHEKEAIGAMLFQLVA